MAGSADMTIGIHHFTGITANVQANIDFYVGFLGLKLVKRTGGYADAEQLHLLYGDRLACPGSLLTFLVWEAAGRGRTGIGQVSDVALAVPPASVGAWLTRAIAAGIPPEGPVREFGEPILRLKDPDGLIVKLVGVDMPARAPLPDAPTRIRSVTLLTDKPAETALFLTGFGYKHGPQAGMMSTSTETGPPIGVEKAYCAPLPPRFTAGAAAHPPPTEPQSQLRTLGRP